MPEIQPQPKVDQPPKKRLSLDDPQFELASKPIDGEAVLRTQLAKDAQEPVVGQLEVGERFHVTNPYYRLATVREIAGNRVLVDCEVEQIQVTTDGLHYTEKVITASWQEVWQRQEMELPRIDNPETILRQQHVVVLFDGRPEDAAKASSPLTGTFVKVVRDTGQLDAYKGKLKALRGRKGA